MNSSEASALLHYRLLDKLGEGGMGTVFKALDTKLGRTVAIKRVAPHAAADDTARRRLLREARSASRLSHPNIVIVFAVEEAEGVDFIVMEHVDGRALAEIVAEAPLDVGRAAHIAAAVADALAHAHSAGIVHRDVKPANVMVTPSGNVKVLDFGIATAFAPQGESVLATAKAQRLTSSGAVVGTCRTCRPSSSALRRSMDVPTSSRSAASSTRW
jgi:serine/threonine-protein kinase